MEYKRELNTLPYVPAKIFIKEINKIKCHWSNKVILTFILKGKIKIKINKKEYILGENDVFLINQNEIYDLEKVELNKVCIIEIDVNYFNRYYDDFSKLKFSINSLENSIEKNREYDYLWNILLKIIQAAYKEEKDYLIVVKKYLFELILVLINRYSYNVKDKRLVNEKGDRLGNIIKFIMEHYKEKIGLKDISENFHLNSQYISRYFSKHMGGITLSEFISNVRLQESLKDLCDEEKKVTYIALEYGFPNSKSYFKAFKQYYGITPLKYRKIQNSKVNIGDLEESSNQDDWKEILSIISNYLNHDNKDNYPILEGKKKYNIDFSQSKGTLNKSWKRITAFGRASEGLREEWRNQLRMLQEDIAFEYIRFHGILSDEMMVYSENYNGEPQYNFSYVEELIDFLLDNNIKPFIELGYMPEQLAEEKIYKFLWKANISFPKDMNKWSNLIENLIKHLIDRYGIKEVSTWYFEIWNNFSSKHGIEKSLDFLKHTYKAVKSVNSKLMIGMNVVEQLTSDKLLEAFNNFCLREDISFEFIGNIIYSIVYPNNELSVQQLLEETAEASKNHFLPQNLIKLCNYAPKNYIEDTIDKFVAITQRNTLFENRIFITEFNFNPDPRDLLNDTCFKAPFLVKNILDNYDKVEGMAYWGFSDIFDEISTNATMFHGGIGLITKSGLKKPIYYAYQLLNKLGDTVVEKGDNFVATKKNDGSVQIIAYNYCDFIGEKTKCSTPEVTFYDRYNVFSNEFDNISFVLKGLDGKYTKKIYRVNRDNGSVFDEYIKIGAPKRLNSDDLNYLNRKAIYEYKVDYIDIDGSYVINENLSPHEVLMIEIISMS